MRLCNMSVRRCVRMGVRISVYAYVSMYAFMYVDVQMHAARNMHGGRQKLTHVEYLREVLTELQMCRFSDARL